VVHANVVSNPGTTFPRGVTLPDVDAGVTFAFASAVSLGSSGMAGEEVGEGANDARDVGAGAGGVLMLVGEDDGFEFVSKEAELPPSALSAGEGDGEGDKVGVEVGVDV